MPGAATPIDPGEAGAAGAGAFGTCTGTGIGGKSFGLVFGCGGTTPGRTTGSTGRAMLFGFPTGGDCVAGKGAAGNGANVGGRPGCTPLRSCAAVSSSSFCLKPGG